MEKSSDYLAYMLRMWSVEQNGQRVWRVSLEDAHTGEFFGFADLADILDFLEGKAISAIKLAGNRDHPSSPR